MADYENWESSSEKAFQARRWLTCSQGHSLKLDKKTHSIILHTNNGMQSYSCEQSENFQELLDNGFLLSEYWSYKGDDVMVATLSKNLGRGRYKYILLFCDDASKKLVGMTPAMHSGKDVLSHVEVFGCALSYDKTILGCVIGTIAGSDRPYVDCTTQLVFYDTCLWIPIRTFQGASGIPPAFSFDPRFKRSRVVQLGLGEVPTLETFCLQTGTVITSRQVDIYDIDGETSLQVMHTADGTGLVVQVIEYLGYGHEFLYRTYVLDNDSLALRSRTEAMLASLCHSECLPQTLPLFAPGSKKMALLSKSSKKESNIRIHRLPLLPSLKEMCRQLLLEPGVVIQSDFNKLPITDELKAYLSLKPIWV